MIDVQIFGQILVAVERDGRGWVHGGEVPNCDVLLNGKPVKNVLSMNRNRGVLRVSRMPLQVHKHGKRVLFKTLHGEVTVVPHG